MILCDFIVLWYVTEEGCCTCHPVNKNSDLKLAIIAQLIVRPFISGLHDVK